MTRALEALSAADFSRPLIHDLRRGAQRVRLGMTLPDRANSLSRTLRVSMAQEILLQAIEPFHQLVAKIVEAGRNFSSSLLISLHLRESESGPVSHRPVGRCRAAPVPSWPHPSGPTGTTPQQPYHPGG